MANTLNLGNGQWATKDESVLAYNNENNNFKPLPFDFSRGSIATVVNKDGLIETVGTKEPRIDFQDNAKGSLLLEPTSTNIITQSEAFDNSYWTKNGSSVVGGFASPSVDSPLGAFKLVASASSGVHEIDTPVSAMPIGGIYSLTIYAKADGYKNLLLWSDALSSGVGYNLETDAVFRDVGTVSHSIETLTGGWKRISVTLDSTASASNFSLYVYDNSATPAIIYTGDGTSGIYIFGAQLEQGSYATSLINTQGTVQTRLADSCSQTVPDGVIGQTEGVLFLDFKPQTLDATSRFLSIENSSSVSNGWMGVFAASVSGDIRFRFYGDGWDFNSSLIIEKDTRYKIAVSYKNGVQTSAYVNGNLIGNLTASLSGKSFQKIRLSEAQFGVRGDADFNDVKLYNTRLSNSELAALTQV